MHDANDLVRVMQQVSSNASEAAYPADVMSGTVISASPLKIKIEQRFDIDSAQLIVPEHLTDHTLRMEVEGVDVLCRIYGGLKEGQEVTLIRKHGGQKFFVAGRVV